ncbi:type II toxin-antitoxin system HicA family toxin [Bacillus velezensis]|uniref:type II toxin-antitoxin system HicA family toxin n=1 Tax=Bacillus velezensis TaxID=492670 RepID=UPI00209EDA9D|nr:type II toxin-antitoxin system HicA family toxin [Bacillus velezensis]MCP1534154.1 hypothetical protein [Bacillus velezensis]MEC3667366.1 hypothetical protein [Bacillus velezensis]
MVRIEKAFDRITRSPQNTNWHELKTVLENFGCRVEDGAKHKKVYHDLRPRPLTISVHNNKVKTVYVKKLIELVKEIKDILEEE